MPNSSPSPSEQLIRSEFPIFETHPNLRYLDFANTALKPRGVIQAISDYYSKYSANVHRSNHDLGAMADEAFEGSRDTIAKWLDVDSNQVVFTKNTTEGINLVAQCYVAPRLLAGDEILITQLEHHANFVPWKVIADKAQARLVISPLGENGEFDLEAWKSLINPRTKFAAFTHSSNVTGETLPIKEMIAFAHKVGVVVLVDAAQSVPHHRVSMVDLDADFFVFSGHKTYGPTGIGILCGKYHLLDEMPPYQTGGDMIETVSLTDVTYQLPPRRFEAGTPAIASGIAFGAAIEFLDKVLTSEFVSAQEDKYTFLRSELSSIPGIRMYGPSNQPGHLITFTIDGVHASDIGAYLNEKDVAVRVGKLCAHPLLDFFHADSAVRVSIGAPTTASDLECFLTNLKGAERLFRS